AGWARCRCCSSWGCRRRGECRCRRYCRRSCWCWCRRDGCGSCSRRCRRVSSCWCRRKCGRGCGSKCSRWCRCKRRCWCGCRRCSRSGCRRCRTFSNLDCVEAPACVRDTIVTAHTPPEHDVLTSCIRRKVHCSSDEASGIITPGAATSDRALEEAADSVCVTIKHEAASRIKDVLECSAADADLQHATIKTTFEVQVVAEAQLSGVAMDGNAWRIEPLVADAIRIINERGIRGRVERR